jgi:hypothetical protein
MSTCHSCVLRTIGEVTVAMFAAPMTRFASARIVRLEFASFSTLRPRDHTRARGIGTELWVRYDEKCGTHVIAVQGLSRQAAFR